MQTRSHIPRFIARHVDGPFLALRGRRTVLVVSDDVRTVESAWVWIDGKSVCFDTVLLQGVKIRFNCSSVVRTCSRKDQQAQFEHLRARLSQRAKVELVVERLDEN